MKSMLRINGIEVVVEDVPPASAAFNVAVSQEINKIFGECETINTHPIPKLGQDEENLEASSSLVFWGREPGIVAMEFVIKTKEAANDIVIPAFIEFAL